MASSQPSVSKTLSFELYVSGADRGCQVLNNALLQPSSIQLKRDDTVVYARIIGANTVMCTLAVRSKLCTAGKNNTKDHGAEETKKNTFG